VSYMKFNNVLDELEGILSNNQKQAEAIADGNVLEGNRKALDGQGKEVPEAKEKGDVDPLHPEPSKTDDTNKSVEYQIAEDAEETKVMDKTLKSEAAKQAAMGNQVLKDIYALLQKAGMEEEEKPAEEYKKPAMDEEPEENMDEETKEMAKTIAEEADIDEEITPEDEEVLKALGAKTAEDRAIYLLSKQAGAKFCDQCAEAGLINNPAMVAEMQKQAAMHQQIAYHQHMMKQAAYIKMLANQQGPTSATSTEKQASTKQDETKTDEVDVEEIIKKASAAATENVIQQIAKAQIGNQAMMNMGFPVNP